MVLEISWCSKSVFFLSEFFFDGRKIFSFMDKWSDIWEEVSTMKDRAINVNLTVTKRNCVKW